VDEPAAFEDKPLLKTKHRGLLLAAVMLVAICQFLDATIANVALPHMQAALGASIDSISWVLTSFIIAGAIFMPATGWLSDRIGSRNLYLGASAGFLIFSMACGAATSLTEMVIFRTLQGISTAFLAPMTQTIMFDISPPSKQAMTISIFSMIVMVAPITGPFIGGLLTEYLNWRWIFYVNLPLGIPALAIMWWLLPSRPIEKRRLDLFGFAWLGLALAALQFMLDRGQHLDWFNSWKIIIYLIVVLSALWIFIIHSRATAHPLFNRQIYKNTNFMIGLAFICVQGLGVAGIASVLPMMLQGLYGYPVMDSGMVSVPRGIGVMITSLIAGSMIRYVDYRIFLMFGYLIIAFSIWCMSGWTLEMGMEPILIAGFIQGLGFGMTISTMNITAFDGLAPELRPDGSSLFALFRNMGSAIGVSIVVTFLARNQQISHADLAASVTSASIQGVDLPAAVDRVPGIGSGVMTFIDAEVNRQALMIAYLDDFFMLTWIMLACIPLALLLRKPSSLRGSQ